MGTKGQASRQRLITAARRMFRHQGFTKTSIDDIARTARVNRGIVYFHFKNKDDLAVAALDQALENEFELLARFMGEEPNPLKRLELMIDGLVRYNAERGCKGGCFFGNFALELGDTNRKLAVAANRFFIRWKELLLSLIGQAKEEALLRAETDGDALALLIMSTIEGSLLICKAGKDTDQFQQTAGLLKGIIAGYASP